MKISKSYIKQIIKEELAIVLKEKGLEEGLMDLLSFGSSYTGKSNKEIEAQKVSERDPDCKEEYCVGDVLYPIGKEIFHKNSKKSDKSNHYSIQIVDSLGNSSNVELLGNGFLEDENPFHTEKLNQFFKTNVKLIGKKKGAKILIPNDALKMAFVGSGESGNIYRFEELKKKKKKSK